MPKTTFPLFCITLLLVLSACSTIRVTTDSAPGAGLSDFRTYALAPSSNGQTLAPSAMAALESALDDSLATRGLVQAAPGTKPDLAIAWHAFREQKTAVHQYTDWGYQPGSWPYAYGAYGMWTGVPRTFTDVTRYIEGTLILDFVDTRKQSLVFRGTAEAIIDAAPSAEKIREAVARIVAGMP